MKGNNKIGITAEFVSIIKSKEDPNYSYFVSPRAYKLFSFLNIFFKKTLVKTFKSRLELSNCIKKIIYFEKPHNIINLGAGFSLEGFNSKKVNYFDVDFPEIINSKKEILAKICKYNSFPSKYHLIGADLLKSYSFNLKGKSVYFAEGVASYLNQIEFELFILGIFKNMKKGDVFIYNEKWSKKNSFSYKVLRYFIALLTKSRAYSHFTSNKMAKKYFLEKGFSKVSFFEKGGFNIIKLVK